MLIKSERGLELFARLRSLGPLTPEQSALVDECEERCRAKKERTRQRQRAAHVVYPSRIDS